ncbi:hypothetical protein DA2_1047 [Desulfovibrio sp. A2]|nr:hypothetical protein DA2_1047 [Desulfovibrio sp. A2]
MELWAGGPVRRGRYGRGRWNAARGAGGHGNSRICVGWAADMCVRPRSGRGVGKRHAIAGRHTRWVPGALPSGAGMLFFTQVTRGHKGVSCGAHRGGQRGGIRGI